MDARGTGHLAVNVLLGVDALQGPLTGIGRYAGNLAAGLAANTSVADLRYFAHGRVLASNGMHGWLTGHSHSSGHGGGAARVFARARRLLAGSPIAVAVYERVLPHLARASLERFSGTHVLHSPNFVLPEFSGRSVATFHDLSTLLMPRYHPPARIGFVNRAMERAARRAQHIITDTEIVRRQVMRYFGVPGDRCTAVPLGADDSFRPRTEVECAEVLDRYNLRFKQHLLFVSTLEPRKNLRRVLHAYAACARRHAGCLPLVIAGDPGWRSQREHQLVRRMEAAGKVQYIGYAPHADLPALMSSARALIFPSLYEGFGLPVLEAMQSGTAVLTSRDSAMDEVCGGAAVTVEPRSVRDISEALQWLMEDDRHLAQLESAGLERARNFSWERCVALTVEVYQKCA